MWLDVKILVATIVSLGGRRTVPLEKMIPSQAGADQIATMPEQGNVLTATGT